MGKLNKCRCVRSNRTAPRRFIPQAREGGGNAEVALAQEHAKLAADAGDLSAAEGEYLAGPVEKKLQAAGDGQALPDFRRKAALLGSCNGHSGQGILEEQTRK